MFAFPITYSWSDYAFEDYSCSWKKICAQVRGESIHNSLEDDRAVPSASSKESGQI